MCSQWNSQTLVANSRHISRNKEACAQFSPETVKSKLIIEHRPDCYGCIWSFWPIHSIICKHNVVHKTGST